MNDEWRPRLASPPAFVGPVAVDPAGITGPTRGQAAGPRWRRSSRNRYVRAGVDARQPGQRVAEAAARSSTATVTGWASLLLQQAAFFDGRSRARLLPVLLVEGDERLRSAPGVTISHAKVSPSEVLVRCGLRCTIPERALVDHILQVDDPRESVVALDMAAAAELTSIRRVHAYLGQRPGARGNALVRAALDLAHERSASPQETRFRLLWRLDAGWTPPLVNRDVLDRDGRFIGRPDLLDTERGIVGEFAGAVHRRRSQHRSDVRREDLFRRAGLEYVEVVGADLQDVPLVVDRMAAAAARVGSRPRRWQLGPEPEPLDDVLDHRDAMIALAETPVIWPR